VADQRKRWVGGQGPVFATVLLTSIVIGGTLGYMVIERWNAWDAFYMTVITITTVGYREIHDLSRAGQAFTVVLLIVGVGAALYTFTLMAAAVVEGNLPQRFQRRRVARMLETIKNHFIICGYGRIGSLVAAQFRQQRIPYVVVERDAARYQAAIDEGGLALEADASREDVLRAVGIARARGLIAAVSTDAENVYTVLSARVLRPDLYIIGRAEGEEAMQKLARAGANRVVSPYQIGAVQIAQTALRPAVVDFVALASNAEHSDLSMEEIAIAPQSGVAGRSILQANLRQQYGVIVVGMQRGDGRLEFNPEPDAVIRAGDKLVVLGSAESLRRLEADVA
jgi:voltage-gated potassium channel